ncbi:hypothetical protein PIB30_029332 [Stylosanthes scabra]|uniref:Uncharacterized protein n=1 Tax=Stylosanthes scabra TaxID=79078 RepID=A0ABU6QAT6_9FABA|nr:hypothetical protein [Stylosanthes scabra]
MKRSSSNPNLFLFSYIFIQLYSFRTVVEEVYTFRGIILGSLTTTRALTKFLSLLRRSQEAMKCRCRTCRIPLLEGDCGSLLLSLILSKVERNKLACSVGPTFRVIVSKNILLPKYYESTATNKTKPGPRVSTTSTTTSARGWVPPQTSTPSTWTQFGLPPNYSPPPDKSTPMPRGAGSFAIRNNPIYSNPPPNTQHIPQGWYPLPLQEGSFGCTNNPQPSFGAHGVGGGPPNFGIYNSHGANNLPQFGSMPQAVSTGANRPIYLEMSRQMHIEPSPTNKEEVGNKLPALWIPNVIPNSNLMTCKNPTLYKKGVVVC